MNIVENLSLSDVIRRYSASLTAKVERTRTEIYPELNTMSAADAVIAEKILRDRLYLWGEMFVSEDGDISLTDEESKMYCLTCTFNTLTNYNPDYSTDVSVLGDTLRSVVKVVSKFSKGESISLNLSELVYSTIIAPHVPLCLDGLVLSPPSFLVVSNLNDVVRIADLLFKHKAMFKDDEVVDGECPNQNQIIATAISSIVSEYTQTKGE